MVHVYLRMSLWLEVLLYFSVLPVRLRGKSNVKCTLVQALRLSTGSTAYRGSRGIALLFLDHGTRRGWGVSVTPRPLLTPGKDPVPVVQEAGWAPGPVWTGAENLAPTGIRFLDSPAYSQSLYPLRYPAHRLRGSTLKSLFPHSFEHVTTSSTFWRCLNLIFEELSLNKLKLSYSLSAGRFAGYIPKHISTTSQNNL